MRPSLRPEVSRFKHLVYVAPFNEPSCPYYKFFKLALATLKITTLKSKLASRVREIALQNEHMVDLERMLASENNNSSGSHHGNMSDPGAMMAFSWACNQAVGGGAGTGEAIKCPFCDTPFISKGAYRHHLSKMHFTKENMGGMGAGGPTLPPAATAARTPSPDSKEGQESLQSKYQKYSQLAKQLSCCEGTN